MTRLRVRRRGQAGVNYCGAWVAIPYDQREHYGWVTRLVCNRRPHEPGRHRSRDGWTWSGPGDSPVPPPRDSAR